MPTRADHYAAAEKMLRSVEEVVIRLNAAMEDLSAEDMAALSDEAEKSTRVLLAKAQVHATLATVDAAVADSQAYTDALARAEGRARPQSASQTRPQSANSFRPESRPGADDGTGWVGAT